MDKSWITMARTGFHKSDAIAFGPGILGNESLIRATAGTESLVKQGRAIAGTGTRTRIMVERTVRGERM